MQELPVRHRSAFLENFVLTLARRDPRRLLSDCPFELP